jgi:hypothetical protein
MDAKARENRITEIITLIRTLETEDYLKRKREERAQKDQEHRTREANRKSSHTEFNREIENLQKLLSEDKKEPWLNNVCMEITGGSLCI